MSLILRIALPIPLRQLFDYLPPEAIDFKALIPGLRVKVPFRSRILIGFFISTAQHSILPKQKLKRVITLIDENPVLSKDVYDLCCWAANYYHVSLGEMLANALPAQLKKNNQNKSEGNKIVDSAIEVSPLILNQAQQNALTAIIKCKNKFQTFLLDGVTGSGKTAIYLQTIPHILAEEKQVLVLVPEISLTPQALTQFKMRFKELIIAYHSGLTLKQKVSAWQVIKTGEAKIVIGTRSAIFLSFKQLGLIVVDEEHDLSFKQQDRTRYHARDLAVKRAQLNSIPIILGSATPSLESLLNVNKQNYICLRLPERAQNAVMPEIQVIDMRLAKTQDGLSDLLIKTIELHLAQQNQVMLFLNRRGFAPVYYCNHCQWIATCVRCEAKLIYHYKPLHLQCHQCDKQYALIQNCKQCSNHTMQIAGIGTQRIEAQLLKYFPNTPIFRIDKDNTRSKGALNNLFSEIHNTKEGAILLGTQMLSKGHHFPKLTLVGIINVDGGLFGADFRASEHLGQLLLQVAGRAGRVHKKGMVLLQTRHPDHPLIKKLINEGYSAFAEQLLTERMTAALPPYHHFAMFKVEAYNIEKINDFFEFFKSFEIKTGLHILGPIPSLITKRKGLHSKQLLIKAEKRYLLHDFLNFIIHKIENFPLAKKIKWYVEVDPLEVL